MSAHNESLPKITGSPRPPLRGAGSVTPFAPSPPAQAAIANRQFGGKSGRLWLVLGQSRLTGLPASVTVHAARDALTTAAAEHPWFAPAMARTAGERAP